MAQNPHSSTWHTVIIGAGASGLFCAGSFSSPKLVIEHNPRAGRKLSITGGGKCNITHRQISAQDYYSKHKHFCHHALAAFPPDKLLALLQQNNIPYIEKEDGRIVTQRATEVTAWLLRRAKANHTSFLFNTQVLQILAEPEQFCLLTSNGKIYARHVVLACGGMSYPQLGATSLAWKIAPQLDLQTVSPRPALVGLRADTTWRPIFRELTGNSLSVKITLDKHIEQGNLLFTHQGISGPAVLQTSLYWEEGKKLSINFVPRIDVCTFLQDHKQKNVLFSKLLSPYIPTKIAATLLQELDQSASNTTKSVLIAAAKRLQHFDFIPAGTMGYTQAEVTAGGIEVSQFDPNTLQCKKQNGLFVIGEALDVTGRVGGYNLHWAWASAQAVANSFNNS
ncbi:MAG: aminoacetone oxidase family FAD-binding enzyme [Elusimicrobiaceae bacterium]|nr:aminoacetone oxidase family FAD-binding enzyme [Elusimicrobiaceae bacterium]